MFFLLQNSGDRLHGGAITSLVDIVGSAAIFATGAVYSGVSVEINVSFLAAAPLDVNKLLLLLFCVYVI
jgi:acyl-coenzyme A thioesterase 13